MKIFRFGKPIAASCVFGLAIIGFSQELFTFIDAKKDLTVRAHSGQLRRISDASNNLILKGQVSVLSANQGTLLESAVLNCKTLTDKAGRSQIKAADASGTVHMVKTVTGSSGHQVTELFGIRAKLTVETATSTVVVDGPVRITSANSAKHQTMVATGVSAIVTLVSAQESARSSGLRTAKMAGPVKVVIDFAPADQSSGSKIPTHVIATGDRMEIDNTSSTPLVKLIGHVQIHGGADITGLSKATLKLNSLEEVSGMEVQS